MDDKEFLGYFEQLSKRPHNPTIKAAIIQSIENIVKTLQAVSHTRSKGSSSSSNNNSASTTPFVSAFGEKIIEDVDYAIKRCVRGGGQSTDACTQTHYAITLKQILDKFGADIKVDALLESINESVSKKNAVSKSEVKHFGMGRLALYKAIVRSEIIEKHSENATSEYTLLFGAMEQELEAFPENVLDICEDIFAHQLHAKQKAKLYFAHVLKSMLKPHTAVATRALIIAHFAHKQNNNAVFAQQSYLDDKINNPKNLKAVLQDMKESYPQEHTAAKAIIAYLRSQYKKESQWVEFWKYLLKDFCLESSNSEETNAATTTATDDESKNVNYRNYFVVLSMLRAFLRSKDFTIEDYKAIAVEELLQLWVKHFSVRNDTMKAYSGKIEKAFVKGLKRITEAPQASTAITTEQRANVINVLHLLRNKPHCKFTSKMPLAKTLIGFLSVEETSEYLAFLKKQLHKSAGFITEYLFYLNEMYVFAELQFLSKPKSFENHFYEIAFHLFENSNPTKLGLLYAKQNQDTKDEQNQEAFVKKYSDLIAQLFNSLLSSTLKLASENFKDQKSSIWRGLNSKNELWIFNILKFIVKKADNFSANAQLTHTLKELQEFIEMADTIEKELISNLQKKTDEEKGFSNKKKRAFCNLIIGVCVMSLYFHDEGLQNLDELKEILEAITTHYDAKLLTEKKPKKKVKVSATQDKPVEEQEDVHFVRVLSDLLVSLLTKSVHYMREISNLCFQAFVHEIDAFSLQTLVDVITRPTEEYVNDMPNEDEDDEEGEDGTVPAGLKIDEEGDDDEDEEFEDVEDDDEEEEDASVDEE